MAFGRDVAFLHKAEPGLGRVNGEEFGRVVDGGGSWILVMAVTGDSALLSLLIDAGAVRFGWMPRWTFWVASALLATTVLAYAATSTG